MQQATSQDIKKGAVGANHRHGGRGRNWTTTGLRRHLERQHNHWMGYNVSLQEMKDAHRQYHPVAVGEHGHKAITGTPWTEQGLTRHLVLRHGLTEDEIYSALEDIVEDDERLVLLRSRHDALHGGTQIQKDEQVVVENIVEEFQRKVIYAANRPLVMGALVAAFLLGTVAGVVIRSLARGLR